MKFVIEIECDNDAFEDGPGEVARILQETRRKLFDSLLAPLDFETPLFDINGNKVGFARFEESK